MDKLFSLIIGFILISSGISIPLGVIAAFWPPMRPIVVTILVIAFCGFAGIVATLAVGTGISVLRNR